MNWKFLWKNVGQKTKPISQAEEAIYELVADEIRSKRLRPGLYAKAFSDAEGDEKKAIAVYIERRMAQLVAQAKEEEEHAQQERERADQEWYKRLEARWRKLDTEEKKRLSYFRATHRQDEATGVWHPIIID
jgi:hypothetical protein